VTWILIGIGGLLFVAFVLWFVVTDLQRKLDEIGEPYPWE